MNYSLRVLLKVSDVKHSTYYYSISKCAKDNQNDGVMNNIIDIFYTNKKRYGYIELAKRRYVVNHKIDKHLVLKMEFHALIAKSKYKSYKGDMNGITKNLLLTKVVDKEKCKTYYERNFDTNSCNEKWSTDVSKFHIVTGKLSI